MYERERSATLARSYTGRDWHLIALSLILVVSALAVDTRGEQGLSLLQDDFFYYTTIAAHIVAGQGSTFNGLVTTNGYHPLWMLCMVILGYFTSNVAVTIRIVELAVGTSAVASFLFVRQILFKLGLPGRASSLLGLGVAALALQPAATGMEVILTLPLGFLLCSMLLRPPQDLKLRDASILGLLAAALILSRLDSILLVVLLAVGVGFDKDWRRVFSAPKLLALGCGLFPVVIYLIANLVFFRTLLPVSGQAKQLRLNYQFAAAAFHSMPEFKWAVVALLVDCAGVVLLTIGRPSRPRPVAAAVLLFPFAHLALISQLSDWPLWSWYFYSAVLAFPIALACLWHSFQPLLDESSQPRVLGTIAAALLLLWCGKRPVKMIFTRFQPVATRVAAASYLQAFGATHPGIYAMVDRSGVVSHELGRPIVQTEGLVMDKPFLTHIARQEDLLSVLRSYEVRYYIASLPPGPVPACFEAREPAQGGPSAPHMRSRLCAKPVGVYNTRDYTTLIYDLAQCCTDSASGPALKPGR